jgi:hypothetical protein
MFREHGSLTKRSAKIIARSRSVRSAATEPLASP